MTYSELEHTLLIFQLLPFSKWHFSKTVDFCGTQGDLTKVNRDRYNIDGPECKKRAYMYLELRTLNNMEI